MTETSKKTTENNAPGREIPWFVRGLRDGIPICMGYFAVAFALNCLAIFATRLLSLKEIIGLVLPKEKKA